MHLRYINIEPDRKRYGDDYAHAFLLNTRFISNFLSREIRKRRFITDGTFDMISISLLSDDYEEETRLVPANCLEVSLSFEPSKYERIRGTNDCEYYLELFERGFRKASEFKSIPLDELVALLNKFRDLGCENEWVHKRKEFKERDICVILHCYLTTNDFRLVARIERLSTKELLCEGVLLKSEPYEVLFQGMFKDILIDGEKIIVTDNGDSPHYLIDLSSAFSGGFKFEVNEILTQEEIEAYLKLRE